MSHFFGLGLDYKLGLHEEIFSLCYHGQGGFSWQDVYDLPIHLRRFYIQQVIKSVEAKNKTESDAQTKTKASVPRFSR